MEYVQGVEAMGRTVAAWRGQGLRIGLVPTMGFLHEGHASLIQAAARENDRVVTSIFVNPMQFGPAEDLGSYPRDMEHDIAVCRASGAHAILFPSAEAMYPPGFHTSVTVSQLSEGLCGRSRPVHFAGVCTVVTKLFNIVRPDAAYFGEKDAQQLAIIRRMTLDLNMPVRVVGCPIVREPDGLAKSSRNAYLTPEQRRAALVLSRSLDHARKLARAGEHTAEGLLAKVREFIEAEPLADVDYIELVDPESMQPVPGLSAGGNPALLAMAVRFGKARLLDNTLLSV